MASYDQYKRLRNHMRRFDLLEGLQDVWRYSLHIVERQPLPTDYAVGKERLTLKPLREHLHPWDLDILAKELVLNAGKGGDRSLKRWNDLAVACNHIRRLEGVDYERADNPPDVMFDLHRIAHRQFPWQSDNGYGPIVRAFKVYGDAAVEELVVRELGMTMRQFLLLGAAVTGHFRRNWGMSDKQDFLVPLKIPRDASEAFFDRVSCTLAELKADTAQRQVYGDDWQYTWNPMEARPLVRFDTSHPDRLICPIPRYLLRRASTGVFFDLVKAAGFDNSYGNAFQTYIGEVIDATCPQPRFKIVAEQPYIVGTDLHHGVDWIVSDPAGHLFIECKAKRLTVDAKTRSDPAALDRDLVVMAKAIVQHYANILRALGGGTGWLPDGLPIYPVILTLEDWYVFSPRVSEKLRGHVERLSTAAGIPEATFEKMPWTVASTHEFEIASQVIAQVGIHAAMSVKVGSEHRDWSLLPFVQWKCTHEMERVNWRLFAADWARLLPDRPG